MEYFRNFHLDQEHCFLDLFLYPSFLPCLFSWMIKCWRQLFLSQTLFCSHKPNTFKIPRYLMDKIWQFFSALVVLLLFLVSPVNSWKYWSTRPIGWQMKHLFPKALSWNFCIDQRYVLAEENSFWTPRNHKDHSSLSCRMSPLLLSSGAFWHCYTAQSVLYLY